MTKVGGYRISLSDTAAGGLEPVRMIPVDQAREPGRLETSHDPVDPLGRKVHAMKHSGDSLPPYQKLCGERIVVLYFFREWEISWMSMALDERMSRARTGAIMVDPVLDFRIMLICSRYIPMLRTMPEVEFLCKRGTK